MKRFWLANLAILSLLAVHAMLGAQVEVYDLVIMNGRVVDGSGNPWFYGDVAIRGDRIVKVGRLGASRSRRRIDATGMIVAPGFIDIARPPNPADRPAGRVEGLSRHHD